MVKVGKIIWRILAFCFLTLLTQVGGVVYLVSLVTFIYIDKLTKRNIVKLIYQFSSFSILYCISTFFIIPTIAKQFGRVPLPLTSTHHIRPLNVMTFLLNRNYVVPELRQTVFEVAEQMESRFPRTKLNYLDANFPFLNGFPLFPHLSHNDGKKLDLSFCYNDANTGNQTNDCPSFIGYGICEEPLESELNTSEYCQEKGKWQYSFMMKIMPQGNKKNFIFNNEKTKELINLFVAQPTIGRLFIEPHLKTRLKLNSEKIKFHGCHAVRHDDHLHIKLN